MKTLQQLIKQNKFDWTNSDINPENFPTQPIRSSDYRLYHFDRYDPPHHSNYSLR